MLKNFFFAPFQTAKLYFSAVQVNCQSYPTVNNKFKNKLTTFSIYSNLIIFVSQTCCNLQQELWPLQLLQVDFS